MTDQPADRPHCLVSPPPPPRRRPPPPPPSSQEGGVPEGRAAAPGEEVRAAGGVPQQLPPHAPHHDRCPLGFCTSGELYSWEEGLQYEHRFAHAEMQWLNLSVRMCHRFQSADFALGVLGLRCRPLFDPIFPHRTEANGRRRWLCKRTPCALCPILHTSLNLCNAPSEVRTHPSPVSPRGDAPPPSPPTNPHSRDRGFLRNPRAVGD